MVCVTTALSADWLALSKHLFIIKSNNIMPKCSLYVSGLQKYIRTWPPTVAEDLHLILEGLTDSELNTVIFVRTRVFPGDIFAHPLAQSPLC